MRIGSLFTGYGGLDIAVANHYNAEVCWYSEIDKAANKVLQAHYDAPNLGDITAINWNDVEPVDILTGGYPCQPFSNAGHRKGQNDERHLWPYIKQALNTIRPMVGIFENVDGHRSLGFADVLGDLAEIGYDAEWVTVRASDVGAPHRRQRLFIFAYASGQRYGTRQRSSTMGGMGGTTKSSRWTASTTREKPGTGSLEVVTNTTSTEWREPQQVHLRETRWTAESRECVSVDWAEYSTAIKRWETVTGRQAPEPTISNGTRQAINPRFVEWMMGLQDGWVTGHGLTPNQELKMLGNGVVPTQASYALQLMEQQ